VSSQHAVAMGNDKPKSLQTVENHLWKALMNMALGADLDEQMQGFIQSTSYVADIREIEVLNWFVQSTPYIHGFHNLVFSPPVLSN
jgi:hypothetical protein